MKHWLCLPTDKKPPVHDLGLGSARPQFLSKIVSEYEQPRVEHDENPADVPWTRFIETHRTFWPVEMRRFWTIALTVKESHSHERIKEIGYGARMEVQLLAEFCTGELSFTESSK